MRRRHLVTLLAAVLLAPVATSAPSGGAVEPDLVVSTTSGAARTIVEVSSASCVDEPDGSIWRFLSVQLLAGAPGDEVLAGAGSSSEGEPARIAIPDWIDPADPAQLVARCWEFDPDQVDDDGNLPGVAVPFDPVAFDVLDPTEPVVQSATYSRTALATGQGLRVDVQGCFLDGSLKAAGTQLGTGSDLTGATGDLAAYQDVELTGTGAEVPLLLNDSGSFVSWSVTNDERPVIEEVRELPSTIAPGPHVALTFCAALSDAGVTYLYYPPTPVEVTGTSPVGDIDLRTEPGSNDVSLEGTCQEAVVEGELSGLDLEAESAGFLRTSGADDDGLQLPSPPLQPAAAARARAAGSSASSRAISGDQLTTTPFSVAPAADGSFAVSDTADFDLGVVRSFATCGDAFAEGFSYDAQIAVIDVPPPTAPTTTTTAPPAPAPGPPPAAPIAGSPTFAG